MSDDAPKQYKVKMVEANLDVQKMTFNDTVVSAIEKPFLSSPESYPYLETLKKTFAGFNGSTQLETRRSICERTNPPTDYLLKTNEAFLGNNRQNLFQFRKFNLEHIYVYRNGLPVADSPISTADDKRLYFNTISDLAYIGIGHGISLTDYPNFFIMVFHLTSTQQASHDFIQAELTNCSISVELKFSVALPNNFEIFIIGEKASTIFVDSARRVSKNHILTN